MKREHQREMWAKRTKQTPWEHFAVIGDRHYLDGALCDPFDFQAIHDAAYQVDGLREETVDVYTNEEFKRRFG
jgi:hypothetical protein